MGVASSIIRSDDIVEDMNVTPNIVIPSPSFNSPLHSAINTPTHQQLTHQNTTPASPNPPPPPGENSSSSNSPHYQQRQSKAHIRLLSFERLVQAHMIPNYEEHPDWTISYADIDHDQSVILFISHVWLRSSGDCKGFTGRPHPDDISWNKYKILVAGLEQFRESFLTPDHVLYLWIDYSCARLSEPSIHIQDLTSVHSPDKVPKESTWKDLVDVMSIVDGVFTPITGFRNYAAMATYKTYYCDEWNTDGPNRRMAYLHRAWCRFELLCAAKLPVVINLIRSENWKGIFKAQIDMGYRPHFIYGKYEFETCVDPIILPKLTNADLEDLHPLRGLTTINEDKEKIRMLLISLQPYIKEFRIGYEGKYVDNLMHGKGIYRYVNGDVYEGEFAQGKFHGYGKASYADGSSYEGTWENHRRHGKGKHINCKGDIYEGGFRNDLKHGYGILKCNNGDDYEGEFAFDLPHGTGKRVFENGDTYEGDIRHGIMHGKGKKMFSNGDWYEGYFEEDLFHGVGVYQWVNGDRYEGNWELGQMHGAIGQLRKAGSGAIYSGVWCEGVLYEPSKKEISRKLKSKKSSKKLIHLPPGDPTIESKEDISPSN